MPMAFANGISIYFERDGAGRARCDTLAHDERGLGRTEVPPGPFSMAE